MATLSLRCYFPRTNDCVTHVHKTQMTTLNGYVIGDKKQMAHVAILASVAKCLFGNAK
jgi:hypothetical protein